MGNESCLDCAVPGLEPRTRRLRAPVLNPLTFYTESAYQVLSVGRVGLEPTHSRVEDFKLRQWLSIPLSV
jgi:hypothetical protein